MQNTAIDVIAEILGNIGKVLALIGMSYGCYILWNLIIKHIIIR